MAGRFGPSRAELKFRLIVGVAGLALTAVAFGRHGIAGIASTEVGLIAVAFFGGTGAFAAHALWRGRGTGGGAT